VRFETEIRDTAYGGYGVGKLPDGRTAFIPFTVEGDFVAAEIIDDKKNFVYADLKEIITPSTKRGEKYCPLIGICGGCSFGHIDYETQKEIKLRIVTQAFRNIDCRVPSSITTAEPLRYRNRATFKVKDGKIGFYGFKSRNFIEVDDCPLVCESLVKKCKEFAAVNKGKDIYELYAVENSKGEALAYVKGLDEDELKFVTFDGISAQDFAIGEEFIEFDTQQGNIYVGGESFLQSNRFLINKLQRKSTDVTGVNALELYCGSGFFTLGLAKNFRSVTAVEVSKEAIKLARRTGLENVRWVAGDVNKFLKADKGRFDNLLVDPPRTGLEKSVINYIRDKKPTAIVYISCNPTTLARDISKLSDLYKVTDFEVIDMFPNTHHVECSIKLTLKG
jgi:23S rRNA (uracil1939-C5)-methyltransferase